MDPPSEPEDTPPASPELIMPFYVLALTQDMDLFQCLVLPTESVNSLEYHVNIEKQTSHDNPAHIEEVSSDKEEIEIPVLTIPLMLYSLPFSQTLAPGPSFPLPSSPNPPITRIPTINTHIPTLITSGPLPAFPPAVAPSVVLMLFEH